MSANIPLEIQGEILKRVAPIKSLIQFRSVSKQWKSLIDSPAFITQHHSLNQNQPHHLLVKYKLDFETNFLSVVDNDSFPDNKFYPTVPPAVKLFSNAKVLDSSHGLVCLYCFSGEGEDRYNMIVLWNPFIRKSVDVMLPDGIYIFGFGVCPKTFDPKIVKITVDGEAEIFSLSTGAWKNISMDLSEPLKLRSHEFKQVVVDGVIHWTDCNIIINDDEGDDDDEIGEDIYRHRIVSFDLISEEFSELYLPDDFDLISEEGFDITSEEVEKVHQPDSFDSTSEEYEEQDSVDSTSESSEEDFTLTGEEHLPYIFARGDISIFKLNESLIVVSYNDESRLDCDVWMMKKKGDVKFLLIKVFSVRLDARDGSGFYCIVGFRNNGQIIRKHVRMGSMGLGTTYEVYEPYTEDSDDLEIEETSDSHFKTTSYTESLLLLNFL